MRPFGTPRAALRVKVNREAIAMMVMEGMSRVGSSSSREERAQLSEGCCCTGDACQGVWWEVIWWEKVRWQGIWWEHMVNTGWTLVVIATKLLVRVTIVILIAREIRLTRLIFRVTMVTGLMTMVTRLMNRATRVTRVTGSYRVSKFLLSHVHHISVWIAVMLERRKG